MTPRHRITAITLTAIAGLLLGCGDEEADFEDKVTITQGVAGTYRVLASDIDSSYGGVRDEEVVAYDSATIVDGEPTEMAVAFANTDADGFFEIALEDGDYAVVVRTDVFNITLVGIQGELVRCDLYDMQHELDWSCGQALE